MHWSATTTACRCSGIGCELEQEHRGLPHADERQALAPALAIANEGDRLFGARHDAKAASTARSARGAYGRLPPVARLFIRRATTDGRNRVVDADEPRTRRAGTPPRSHASLRSGRDPPRMPVPGSARRSRPGGPDARGAARFLCRSESRSWRVLEFEARDVRPRRVQRKKLAAPRSIRTARARTVAPSRATGIRRWINGRCEGKRDCVEVSRTTCSRFVASTTPISRRRCSANEEPRPRRQTAYAPRADHAVLRLCAWRAPKRRSPSFAIATRALELAVRQHEAIRVFPCSNSHHAEHRHAVVVALPVHALRLREAGKKRTDLFTQ